MLSSMQLQEVSRNDFGSRFAPVRMDSTWDEFYYKRSFVAVLEKYVHTVDQMLSTVLIPSRLMDIPMSEIQTKPLDDRSKYLQNNMDLWSFYSFMKALKTQVALGTKHIEENGERDSQLQCEMRETTNQINKLTLVAKYVRLFAQETDLFTEPLAFEEFEKDVRFTEECNLLVAIRKFLGEVNEMEKSVLFPNRLKDHELVGNWPKIATNKSLSSLHDIFTLLKLLKNEIIVGPQEIELADQMLQKRLCQIYKTIQQYTNTTTSLTERYKQEVECI